MILITVLSCNLLGHGWESRLDGPSQPAHLPAGRLIASTPSMREGFAFGFFDQS
jgi:hypothetical protein